LEPFRVERKGGFLGASASWEGCRWVLVGIPLDDTASFRPGTRFAPARIREVSEGLEEYSLRLDRSLEEAGLHDLGDLRLVPGHTAGNLQQIEACVAWLAEQEKRIAVVGGEHLLTYGVLRALAGFYPDLAVLHWDAHADLRPEYLGSRLSHATTMHLVRDLGLSVYHLGIRSAAPEERALVSSLMKGTENGGQGGSRSNPGLHSQRGRLFAHRVAAPMAELVAQLRNHPVYLTCDIDVLDPAFAPGTGCPEPGGVEPEELFRAIGCLERVRLVGFDVVEVNPLVDVGDITSLVAAKLIRELLLVQAGV
jgi:agmatinase